MKFKINELKNITFTVNSIILLMVIVVTILNFYNFYKKVNQYDSLIELNSQTYKLNNDYINFIHFLTNQETNDSTEQKLINLSNNYLKEDLLTLEKLINTNKFLLKNTKSLYVKLFDTIKKDLSFLSFKETINSQTKKQNDIYAMQFISTFHHQLEQILTNNNQEIIKVKSDKNKLVLNIIYLSFIPFLLIIINFYITSAYINKNIFLPILNIVNTAKQIQKSGYISTEFDPDDYKLKELQQLQEEVNKTALSITELMHDKQQIKLNSDRLDMVPVVAHNILNPLNSIKFLAQQAVLENDVDEESVSYFNNIVNNVDMLTNWVRVLLFYYSDSESDINSKVSYLHEIVTSSLNSIQYILKQRKVSVFYESIPTHVSFLIDRPLIEQALTCIMTNAIEACPRNNNGLMTIVFEDFLTHSTLKIIDTGKGLPESFFNDTEKTLEKKQMGRGIGIPFIKKIADLHDNVTVAWANNENSVGSNVTLTFTKNI